jgi:di/tripeptidase
MENRKKVILQAHMDMVPQKNNDTVHDFENDPIETYIDGDWVKAKGTTLGADDDFDMGMDDDSEEGDEDDDDVDKEDDDSDDAGDDNPEGDWEP